MFSTLQLNLLASTLVISGYLLKKVHLDKFINDSTQKPAEGIRMMVE